MITTFRHARSKVGDDMQLLVEQTDFTKLCVRAGAFRLLGENMVLAEDAEWEFTQQPTERMWADGFIVRDRSTGEVAVLVDEFTYGEGGERYDFNSGPYELVHYLFRFDIPAGMASLESVICFVEHIVEVVEEEGEDG